MSFVEPVSIQYFLDLGLIDIGDGYRAKNSELGTEGVPFARAGNIDGGFNFDGADRFPHQLLASLGSKVSQPGDSLFTSKGTVGRIAFVEHDTPRFVYSPQLCYWRSKEKDVIDPRFLNVWMRSDEFAGQIAYLKGQTDMADYVSLRDQRRMKVTFPPIHEQRYIGEVVFGYDDKISLNRQINQTLEQMAQALFQSWFVDFEPVKAKVAALADGRDPLRAAMSTLSGKTDAELDELPGAAFDTLAATAALFPEEMEESGERPKGWGATTLGKYVAPSGVSVTAEDLKGDEAYFGLEHLPRRSIALDAWGQTAGLESGKRRFTQGTILFGKLRPYFHKVGVAPLDGVCSTDILALQPKTPAWFGYALAHLSSDALIAFAERLSNGAKMPRVGWKDLENYPVVAPDEQLASSFNRHVKSSADAIRKNIFESRALATLRDSLLPKLLSGELAVTPEEAPT